MKINLQSKQKLLTSFVLLFLIASGCTRQEEKNTAFDLSNAKKEIEAANQNFMEFLSKGDSAGIASIYATDAKLMGPNAPTVVGRENIKSTFGSYIRSGITKADLKLIDVWGTAEIITEEGELTLFISDGTMVEKGKYIVVWKKEGDNWKIYRDIFNSDLPVPAPN
jgi:ketosteroid isomerase-like protein